MKLQRSAPISLCSNRRGWSGASTKIAWMYGRSRSAAIAPERSIRPPERRSGRRISFAKARAPRNAIAPNTVAVPNSSVDIENSPTSSAVNPATNATGPSEPSTFRIARYTSSGIGKTRTRLMNPMMFAPMYALNPNRHPPANDAQNRCVSRLHTRYAAHAASAGAAASQALSDASGPNTAVIGHATSAGPGTKADQDKLTPVGANTELAYKGLTPWLRAQGVHSSAHW